LVDALTALIFIATTASTARKLRAYRKAKAKDPNNDQRLKKMQHKLRVIPTCRWRDDSSTSVVRQEDGPRLQSIKVASSDTNIQDIRAYVLSTMPCLTDIGGLALILETILRIHGRGVVARMVEKARREAQQQIPNSSSLDTNSTLNKKGSLICCTCADRQKAWLEEHPMSQTGANKPEMSRFMDSTPPGHECMTVELFSLLVTGRVYSTWKGWSTKGLGFGVLLDKPGLVGWQLARPEKPVWVLRGETCFSVVWLEDVDHTVPRDISKLDRPGTTLSLTHWNCWYGQRNKSELRLHTAPAKWEPPTFSKKLAMSFPTEQQCHSSSHVTSPLAKSLLLERRRKIQSNVVSADEHEANEEKELHNRITDEEMNQTKSHPEDEHFYPGQTHWSSTLRQSNRSKQKKEYYHG
jgi:hypothetical protein